MVNGKIYREMIISAANLLESKKEEINSLNIFPVPDGDTGINMSLTMSAGRRDMQGFSGSLSECSAKVAAALLRGGRGNSGVILSLFFRGVSKALAGKQEADLKTLAAAFSNGVDAAYKAVRKPTEGTVLTVMRVMAEKANAIAPEFDDANDMGGFFDALLLECNDILSKTPEMLPVLKQANVVDAGGMGFTVIFEGMTMVARGDGMAEATVSETAETKSAADFGEFETGDIKFGYCTECIVDKNDHCTDEKVSSLNSYINGVGDSVVFVDDDTFVKFHVHTNDPGKVITQALKCGSLSMVKIENMRNQHSEMIKQEDSQPEEEAPLPPEKKYGFVAIAAGEGMTAVFKDLGVDSMVEGGQTMNPSTEDIISAVNRTPAEIVYVLPNNKNIYMAAKQAEAIIEDKKVVVLRSHTIPQGISAMLAFDPEGEEDDNTSAMKEAMKAVTTAKLTFAARDSSFDGMDIKEGQILGLVENDVKYVCDSREECLKNVAADIKDRDYITLFYGEGVDEDEANAAAETIKEVIGDVEIMVVNGGQPVYYYIISAENA